MPSSVMVSGSTVQSPFSPIGPSERASFYYIFESMFEMSVRHRKIALIFLLETYLADAQGIFLMPNIFHHKAQINKISTQILGQNP